VQHGPSIRNPGKKSPEEYLSREGKAPTIDQGETRREREERGLLQEGESGFKKKKSVKAYRESAGDWGRKAQ